MRSKAFAVIALFAVASMVLAACGTPTPQTVVQTVIVAGTPQVIEVTPTPGPVAAGPKVLRYGNFLSGDVPTIDPALTTDTSSVQIVEETSVGVSRQNEVTSNLEPGMATKWDVSADGLTYTFHLRTDVPWVKYDAASGKVVKVQDANGKDVMVTAGDFAYGILRTLNPATASSYAYVLTSTIKGANDYNSGKAKDSSGVGVKAVDAATLEVTFMQPAVYNANIVGMWVGHAQPKWLIDDKGPRWTETGFQQSYGPYTLKEWVHDSSLTLIKNPFWPGQDNIPQAKIDEIVFSMLDEGPQFAAYEAGDADTSVVPSTEIDRVKADPTLSKELNIAPVMCTYYYGFNTKAKFVDDVRVRLALSEAVDRQSLIDNVTKGGQQPAQWFDRPGLGGSPTMKDHPDLGVKYNPADAKAQLDAYLKEKNLTVDKLDLTLMFNTSSGHQKIAEAIQQMWKANLGVTVKLVNQEWKVYLNTIRDPVATPQIWRLGWCQDYPDANNFDREAVGFGSSANPAGGGGLNWKNPTYEGLLDQAAKETDPTKRVDLYAQAESILVKTDAVLIPIYWYTGVGVTKPNVARTYSVLGGLEHFEKWDISK
jgi:oligopeptide transport system substrate-binding protein